MLEVPTTNRKLLVPLAFAAVYVIWGSTYLAILIAIRSIPPYLMAGVRFFIAGTTLYATARLTGAERPTLKQWRVAALIGALLLLIGNGTVVWSEQYIPSGVAALLIATTPLWMTLLDWARPNGPRPTLAMWAGLLLGFAGVGFLVLPTNLGDPGSLHPIAMLTVVAAAFAWAAGSLYARSASVPGSQALASGMQQLTAGVMLSLASVLLGEPSRFDASKVTAESLWALGYLIVFGSIVAFSAYTWLLRVSTPARVSTYAFVNPAVAVFLGWLFADEPLSPRTLVATAVIVGAVALLIGARRNLGHARDHQQLSLRRS